MTPSWQLVWRDRQDTAQPHSLLTAVAGIWSCLCHRRFPERAQRAAKSRRGRVAAWAQEEITECSAWL